MRSDAIKAILFFCVTSITASQAADYQLNPFQLKLAATNSLLKKSDHDLWIRSFYQEITLKNMGDRKQIKDDQGQGIVEKLRLAADEYLQLQPQRANESAREALEMVAGAVPYSEIAQDFSEIVSILWLSGSSDTVLISGFCEKDYFLNKLPVKSKSAVIEKCNSLVDREFRVPPGVEKMQIIGFENTPSKLKIGRYLVHRVENGYLSGFWLDITEKSSAWTQLWKRNLWTAISPEKVKVLLIKSKPAHLPTREISLITPEHPVPVLIVSVDKRIGGTQHHDPFTVFKEEAEISASEPSIIKSPWFWIISSSLAGLAGYVVYEGLKEKEITTP